MPSLMRFLAAVLVLGALGFAGVVALANLVEPGRRDMTITVPADRFGAS